MPFTEGIWLRVRQVRRERSPFVVLSYCPHGSQPWGLGYARSPNCPKPPWPLFLSIRPRICGVKAVEGFTRNSWLRESYQRRQKASLCFWWLKLALSCASMKDIVNSAKKQIVQVFLLFQRKEELFLLQINKPPHKSSPETTRNHVRPPIIIFPVVPHATQAASRAIRAKSVVPQ